MKTTENISLAGYAFTIETEAYQELNTYLNDIKDAFKNDDNADEITADIEERIAELLKEKFISGMVIDMSQIKEIESRIGNPKELAQEEGDTATEQEEPKAEEPKKDWKQKRLYRNIDEKMLAGVCSGLAAYFGIDKALIRLGFIILQFISLVGDGDFFFIPFLAYICLWIAMPAARTDEQKREMKGRPINLDNYRSKDFDFRTEAREAAHSPAGQAFKRVGGVFLGLLMLLFGLGGLVASIIIPAVPTIADEMLTGFLPIDPSEQALIEMLTLQTFWFLVFVMSCIMSVWSIYNGIMLLFDLKYPSWRPGLILFIAWIFSIFAIFAWFIKTAAFDFPILMMDFIR